MNQNLYDFKPATESKDCLLPMNEVSIKDNQMILSKINIYLEKDNIRIEYIDSIELNEKLTHSKWYIFSTKLYWLTYDKDKLIFGFSEI